MAVFPSIPAEMPGVRLSRHAPSSGADDLEELSSSSTNIDWSQLADEAAQNADLDITEHLLPPPEVIEIDGDADYVYVPPLTPFIKQEPVVSTPTTTPHVPQIPPSSTSSRTSTQNRRLPGHLHDYHLFTTVADKQKQPKDFPYRTAGGTVVDLAILDEQRMAHLCHFVMVHTATSPELARQGHPTKKQYSLKAGLKRFGSRGDKAVTKELSQLHTLNCFCPCDPTSLT